VDEALSPAALVPGSTPGTRVRRLPEKSVADPAVLYAVLDEALVAHVAVVDDDRPVVLPMACARDGDVLLLHGSTGSRVMRKLAEGAEACATVTLLDGLVLARSAFESSMHYRSVVVFGRAVEVRAEDKEEALRRLTDHLLPGRWDSLRPALRRELAATTVVRLPLAECSVKVADGWPDDADDDLDWPVWAGVVPLSTTRGQPRPDPRLRVDVPAP
jgi:nitroimidazol reductase NimA-like FMN-containing flavoprotein (pyridoxamine 5'-phosphate oxidase superfamily)